MSKYKVVIDYGYPFSVSADSDSELKKVLFKYKRMANDKKKDKYPFFDIWVYENNKDVTDKVFKKLKIR